MNSARRIDEVPPSPIFPRSRPELLEVFRRVDTMLPDLAVEVIHSHLDISVPANQAFAAAPDDPAEHTPTWHQFGIITHSRKFAEDLLTLVPGLLDTWDLTNSVADAVAVEVDGVAKHDLLYLAALVHDVGKFSARKVRMLDDNQRSATFGGHERDSGKIIRHELRERLVHLGLSDAHIEYVATCAELHFELGKVRLASKNSTHGYTMTYTESSSFATDAAEVMDAYPDFALEIGIQFIADSSSKTTVAAEEDTDEGIAAQRPALEQQIATRGLHPLLINQALQQPVNFAVARGYLNQWAGRLRSA